MSKFGAPRLGEKPRGGMVVDKSGDSILQQMIADVLPKFKQLTYKDAETGITMNYNLYAPKVQSPEDGKGCEHMMSFDYAYKVNAVRQWLFEQKR